MFAFRKPLLLVLCVATFSAAADDEIRAGKLLVATELVGGPAFAKSVVLILRYNESGALGLVINRPTDIAPEEALPDERDVAAYRGKLYFGGPVELHTLRVLIRTQSPPANAIAVFDNVYAANLTAELLEAASDSSTFRFYLGYAGWAPGQLEREMAEGSWQVVPATGEIVFSDDPTGLWERLRRPAVLRVSL